MAFDLAPLIIVHVAFGSDPTHLKRRPEPFLFFVVFRMSNRDKRRSEFLTILNARDCGAKLARFEDWAACHDPKDVRDVVKTDDRPVLIMPIRIPGAPDKK